MQEVRLLSFVEGLVDKLSLLSKNIKDAHVLDTLSRKRYTIATRLYQLGKINLLELQSAEVEKDNAALAFVYTLKQFWETYYLLRATTLIDL